MDDPPRQRDLQLERRLGGAFGVLAGLAVLYYLYGPRVQQALTEPEPPAAEAASPTEAPTPSTPAGREPEAATEAPPEYPLPEPVAAPAAPAARDPPAPAPPSPAPRTDLAASDAEVRAAAAGAFGAGLIEAFLVPQRIVQNIVATVDSLDREPVPLRFRALVNVPEVPVVEEHGDTLVLSTDNDERYRRLADTLRATSARSIADLYLRYYPLLQRAYREMGYPRGHFNDRVVAIIDHLLAAPDVEHPIELVRPKVLYQFADPALEDLSSGQKIMVRIGPANATIAKQRLRELREILAAGGKK